mmetsp:Transcript_9173/g.31056  ORF Transcript_9173/g.31056 Transcript_9173/m.31056 type:complete len:243 (-) Transcript_9173:209-937(-)
MQPTGAACIRVLAFGDSLTAGFTSGGRAFWPYAPRLAERLGPGWQVDHTGLSGWTARQMAANAEEDHLVDVCGMEWPGGLRRQLRAARAAGSPYDAVCLLAGTNDLPVVAGGHCTAEDVGDALRSLCTHAHEEGATVIALAVPHSTATHSAPSMGAARKAVNKRLAALQASGCVDRIVDPAAMLPLENSSLWDDGLHLTQAGYVCLADAIFEGGQDVWNGLRSGKRGGPEPGVGDRRACQYY